MASSKGDRRRRRHPAGKVALGLGLLLGASALALPALARDPITAEGAMVMTGFAGTNARAGSFFRSATPVDETFINPGGVSLRVFDLSDLKGEPQGQLAKPKIRLNVKAREIGQVFGVALDNGTPPNIYAAASSVFGLQIAKRVGEDSFRRLKTGTEGAEWMPGQFGPDGDAGTIWRIDGVSGKVTKFATIGRDGVSNSGPGIGNITFAPDLDLLFASDLDTGLIHAIDLTGEVIAQFDHGTEGRPRANLTPVADDGRRADITSPQFDVEDPETWGYTQPERRIWGLAFRDGRLYYAIWANSEIWSVSVGKDGSFGKDARREFTVPSNVRPFPVASLAFDGEGRLYAAERGEIRARFDYEAFTVPRRSRVLRFERQADGRWSPEPVEFPIGFPATYQNASGGVALGPAYDNTGKFRPRSCWGTVWATGDSLRQSATDAEKLAASGELAVDGAQGFSASLSPDDNRPPLRSYFIDFDRKYDNANAIGHVGSVAIVQNCSGEEQVSAQADSGTEPSADERPAEKPSSSATRDTSEGPESADNKSTLSDQFGNPIQPNDGGTEPGDRSAEGQDEPTDIAESVPEQPARLHLADLPRPFDLSLAVRAGTGVCSPEYTCPFTLTVTNHGPGEYRGPLVIAEEVDRAVADLADWSPRTPWSCERRDTTFVCRRENVSLAPGESLSLRVDFVPWAIPAAQIQNCARIDWRSGGLHGRNRLVQETLARLGYDTGTPDGLIGAKTRSAIAAFNRIEGRAADSDDVNAALLSFLFGVWGAGDLRQPGDRDCQSVPLDSSARSYRVPPDCPADSVLLKGRCHTVEQLCGSSRMFNAQKASCSCPAERPLLDPASGACIAYTASDRTFTVAPSLPREATSPAAAAAPADDSTAVPTAPAQPTKPAKTVQPGEPPTGGPIQAERNTPATPREKPRDIPTSQPSRPPAPDSSSRAITCPGNQTWNGEARRCDCPADLPIWDRNEQRCIASLSPSASGAATSTPAATPRPDLQICTGNRVWNAQLTTCVCPADLPRWDEAGRLCLPESKG